MAGLVPAIDATPAMAQTAGTGTGHDVAAAFTPPPAASIMMRMNDSESPAAAASLEDTLAAWDAKLAGLERQAGLVLRAARRLRKAAHEGAVAGFASAVDELQAGAETLQAAVAQDARAPDFDLPAAFADGRFLDELSRATAAVNVTLVQRDGRITAYPVVLRLDARNQGVRVGRRLERRIRPSFLAGQLRALQQRGGRFNARSFLDRLLRAYIVLAGGWQPNKPGEGPLVPLADLYELLTLWPAAAADYPIEEFLVDLLRLDREPDARTGRGHRFELGGSTGTKGAKRLTVFDETGAQHDYYAIRFLGSE
jgi:hypothetical protein